MGDMPSTKGDINEMSTLCRPLIGVVCDRPGERYLTWIGLTQNPLPRGPNLNRSKDISLPQNFRGKIGICKDLSYIHGVKLQRHGEQQEPHTHN